MKWLKKVPLKQSSQNLNEFALYQTKTNKILNLFDFNTTIFNT